MKSNFFYTFPAIKGFQSSKEYFVIMCPLNILSKLFIFNEEEIPAEYRSQRILNKTRIPEIANYIINNTKDYVFSSLTASIDGEFEFSPFDKDFDKNIGLLKISMDSKLLINDGQHRRAAIEEALKAVPELGKETISIVLFIDEGLRRSQQIFSDLNKHAVNVSKSIGILYDSRDPIALITKRLLDNNNFLKNFTDKENTSLPKYSTKLFTLSSIYETNKKLLNKINPYDKQIENFIFEFWECLCINISEWMFVFNKEMSAHNFRNTYINSNGVVLEAIGIIGNYLYTNKYSDWKNYISKLDSIDWNRNNLKDWENRAIAPNGRIVKNANYIKLTCILIKSKIALPLTKEEIKLENEFKK